MFKDPGYVGGKDVVLKDEEKEEDSGLGREGLDK